MSSELDQLEKKIKEHLSHVSAPWHRNGPPMGELATLHWVLEQIDQIREGEVDHGEPV